jgi:K+-transporting ATPase ATPase B chain
MARQQLSLFDRKLLGPALLESFKKLDPRIQWRNPVMFVVYLGTVVTAILFGQALAGHGEARAGFILAITIWLLFTILFANFAEALAEGRSRAQASALRNMRQTVMAKRLLQNRPGLQNSPGARQTTLVKAEDLRKGDVVLVETHDTIPADGEVIEGVASVDESAITGESAPVIRESGGDFASVTGGTRVLSDWLVVRVTVNPGETFLDRMISAENSE